MQRAMTRALDVSILVPLLAFNAFGFWVYKLTTVNQDSLDSSAILLHGFKRNVSYEKEEVRTKQSYFTLVSYVSYYISFIEVIWSNRRQWTFEIVNIG